MKNAIEIENFYKSYNGVEAVKGITMKIRKGEMFGLVGPDGAGKTTTMRTLCGLISPDKGNASVLGFDVAQHKKKIQKNI